MHNLARLRDLLTRPAQADARDAASVGAPNVLVISDLHLGEDVKPYSVGYLRHLARLERELEDFLDHYTRTRHDGRPWRLIVNGDMVDFMSVCLLPEGEVDPTITEDERKFGLGSGPQQTKRKLEEVVRRHPGVFRQLARFIASGNELVIVLGNHDMEFHWTVVQDAFREALHRFACELYEMTPSEDSRSAIFAQVSFHPWFYYERDLLYVEHGHQYDEYCSFDYILNPESPRREGGILLSIGHTAIRYFVNLIPDMDPHGQEEWTLPAYLRWAAGQGLRGLVRLIYYYCLMIWRMLGIWHDLRERAQDLRRRQEHEARLRELALRYQMDEQLLKRLEALKRPMVLRDLFALVQTLFLDRFALAMLWGLSSAAALLWAPAAGKIAIPVLATALAVLGNRLLARRRDLDPGKKLARVPGAIQSIVHTRFIVFGHSHDPVAQPLPEGAWYFNTGTWVPAERPGLLHAFTHLLIRRSDAGAVAQLCQWRNGGSLAYPNAAK
jgi:UDP-2,3-diacylglucosamine pyrophosphatase LpxH